MIPESPLPLSENSFLPSCLFYCWWSCWWFPFRTLSTRFSAPDPLLFTNILSFVNKVAMRETRAFSHVPTKKKCGGGATNQLQARRPRPNFPRKLRHVPLVRVSPQKDNCVCCTLQGGCRRGLAVEVQDRSRASDSSRPRKSSVCARQAWRWWQIKNRRQAARVGHCERGDSQGESLRVGARAGLRAWPSARLAAIRLGVSERVHIILCIG